MSNPIPGRPPAPSLAASDPSSRRAHARAKAELDAVVHEITAEGLVDAPQAGKTFDLSRGGMGLLLKRMVHPGKTLVVVLSPPGKPKAFYFGEVRSCYYLPEIQAYQVGIKFTAAPSSKPVREWLSAQTGSVAA